MDSIEHNPIIINGCNRTVDEIVSELKFISSIQRGYIVYVNTKTLSRINWESKAYRTFVDRREGRELTLNYIKAVYVDAYTALNDLLSRSVSQIYLDTIDLLIESLKTSREGLTSTANTYMDKDNDVMYRSKVHTERDLLDSKIKIFESRRLKLNSNNSKLHID